MGPKRSRFTVKAVDESDWRSRFAELTPGEVRPSPFPEDVVLTTPRLMLQGAEVPRKKGEEVTLMVVARFILEHPSISTPWHELELDGEGPFVVKTEREDQVTVVGARADAGEQQLRVVKPSQDAVGKPSVLEWLATSADTIHASPPHVTFLQRFLDDSGF